jgi:hypothetical protein
MIKIQNFKSFSQLKTQLKEDATKKEMATKRETAVTEYNALLAKFNISNITELSEDDRSLFMTELTKEGNAFGAARAEAIAKGDDKFKVDGEEIPVEDVDDKDKDNAKEFVKESSITEAKMSKIHKAAKQGSYPAVIVVVENGKVIHQEPVVSAEHAPAAFNVMQEKYPKALLHLEDNTGKRLFSESILTTVDEAELSSKANPRLYTKVENKLKSQKYNSTAEHHLTLLKAMDPKKLSRSDLDTLNDFDDMYESVTNESLTIPTMAAMLLGLGIAARIGFMSDEKYASMIGSIIPTAKAIVKSLPIIGDKVKNQELKDYQTKEVEKYLKDEISDKDIVAILNENPKLKKAIEDVATSGLNYKEYYQLIKEIGGAADKWGNTHRKFKQLRKKISDGKVLESVITEAKPAGLTKEETLKVAQKFADAIAEVDDVKVTVNMKTLEEDSFDLDYDGTEFDGGSYNINADGSVVNMAVRKQPTVGTKDDDVKTIVKFMKKHYGKLAKNESVVTEGKNDYMARYKDTNINLKKAYNHLNDEELNQLYLEIGELIADNKLKVKDVAFTFESVITEGVYVPSNIEDFAKRRGILPLVKKVGKWAEKAGKRINGGTAIGKGYNTLVLDLKHHGSEIRIDLDTEEVTLHGTVVTDSKSFNSALKESIITESISSKEEKSIEDFIKSAIGKKVKLTTKELDGETEIEDKFTKASWGDNAYKVDYMAFDFDQEINALKSGTGKIVKLDKNTFEWNIDGPRGSYFTIEIK